MKEKRLKKGAKEAACSKKEFETIVVQRLSAEVSGKAQKYSRVGAREFVSFEEFGELDDTKYQRCLHEALRYQRWQNDLRHSSRRTRSILYIRETTTKFQSYPRAIC